MVHTKIEDARKAAGLRLKPLAEKAGLNYQALYQQLSRRSPVPFETVDAIATALNLPLEHFSAEPRSVQASLTLAQSIIASASQLISLNDERASGPDVATFWRRLSEVDFRADELGEIGAHIDLYESFDASDCIPTPLSFGRKSLARTQLELATPKDYFQRIPSFTEGIKKRSALVHARASQEDFQVSTEVINQTINGKVLAGCYLRAVARVQDRSGKNKTAVMTQYVKAFPA